jgi:enoyl-CoA hydratase/carnithine racemase
MMAEPVKIRIEGATAHLVLDQPDSRNAMSIEMREALKAALRRSVDDAAVRVIVLSGNGKAFSAGGDLKSLADENNASMLKRQHDSQELLRLIMTGDKPVIAAVEGFAVGAGLSLACACDIVVASSEARFGAVFGKVGLGPDYGLTWTLPRRVGMGRARLMLLTARLIEARSAADWGIVDELVEPGQAVAAASRMAEEIAANAPLPLGISRRALAQPFAGLDQALDFEALCQSMLIGTKDFAEGAAAFRDKRGPGFTGK